MPMASRFQRLAAPWLAAAALVLAPGCRVAADRQDERGDAPGQAQEAAPFRVIQHEEPRRDFVGPRPPRFRWSAIDGAHRYAIGLWNEADRLVWRRDDLTAPTVAWPEGLEVEPGTYFWSVSAIQGGREIAKSGTAAFVVE
jgi:hypothetical protein